MWFVRTVGILEIMRRRGIQEGTLLDNLDMFPSKIMNNNNNTMTQDESTRDYIGNADVFVSFTGYYTLDHFVEVLTTILWGCHVRLG